MMAPLIFGLSIGLIAYVLGGYPILLALYARRFEKPIEKAEYYPRVSVVVPVRNGARWIEAKLRSLLASDYPAGLLDILVVSDGSIDGTNELVANYGDPRVALLALPPGGKAVAVTRGLAQITGDIVVLTDVRQEFHPQAIKRMMACFADPSVGVVTGELIIRQGHTLEEHQTGLYWRYEKCIRRNLNRIDAMLGATGSIYAIRRELAAPVPEGILLDDVYLPFVIAFQGRRIYFEDQAKAYDLPTSLQSEFWRKVRTQAGVYQIIAAFPRLLWPGERRFLYFVSHKVGRLMVPFALLAVLMSSFMLPSPWKSVLIGAQAFFYMIAAVDPLVPERNPVKRLSAVIRAFVVLVAAAGCGVVVLFRPANQIWKETKVERARASEHAGLLN